MYSNHMQTNLVKEYAFLVAASGGLAGASISRGDAIGTTGGVFSGAVFGSILGIYIIDDTYIIISRVTFAEIKDKRKSSKSISFSRSPKHRYEEEDRQDKGNTRGFKILTRQVFQFSPADGMFRKRTSLARSNQGSFGL